MRPAWVGMHAGCLCDTLADVIRATWLVTFSALLQALVSAKHVRLWRELS